MSKRSPPLLSAPGDNYYAVNNNTSPGLVVLDNWKADRPAETVLLADQLPPGCAMHADVAFDGQRIVFAYADHSPPRDQWQFFLYEIRADGTGLRQITGTDSDPLAGAGGRMTVMQEDYDPCYLPDGGIAFISTRNQGGVRCHTGDRYCPTYLLYRCDADGSHIRQLSFGEANEWDPAVMPDGQILWTRWDYINRPVIPTLGLWTIRPDGTAAEHYFGNYTPNPCRICEARPIPGSRKIIATTAGHHTMHAGSLILVDRQIAPDGLQAITRVTPEATFPESEPSSLVSFASPYPLHSDLFLAAFSPHPYPASMAHVPRHDAFGIYLVDSLGGRELIYRDPEISCFEPMPLVPRPTPPVLPSQVTDSTAATGVFYLQDVYQSTQGIARGTIRRLRVNQLIPQPTQRVPFSGAVTFDVLKRILGTVPVDENGSVAFEAPAGVPLQFQALDQDGMAVMTMRTFTHLQPGERVGCVGCHEPRNASPTTMQTPPAAPATLPLEPPAGPQYPGGFSFAKTVQPVLDRYCIECHGLQQEPSAINALGSFDATDENVAKAYWQLLPSTAYASLALSGPHVKIAQYGGETWYSEPRDYFAHGGTLAQLLIAGHEGVELDPQSRQRIFDWLDLNAPLYGTYSWNKDEWRRPDPQGEQALRAPHPSPVRRQLGCATVRGAGQRGDPRGKPHPPGAPGLGRRRLGPGRDRPGRVARDRRAGVPQNAAARAGSHPALTLSRHRRHLRPGRGLSLPQLLGPQGTGGAPDTPHYRPVTEVLRPMVHSRVEESHDLPRLHIDGGDIAPFQEIAEIARPGEIVLMSWPAMLLLVPCEGVNPDLVRGVAVAAPHDRHFPRAHATQVLDLDHGGHGGRNVGRNRLDRFHLGKVGGFGASLPPAVDVLLDDPRLARRASRDQPLSHQHKDVFQRRFLLAVAAHAHLGGDQLPQQLGHTGIVRFQFQCRRVIVDLEIPQMGVAADNRQSGLHGPQEAHHHQAIASNATVHVFNRAVHEQLSPFDDPDRRAAVGQFREDVARNENRLAHSAQLLEQRFDFHAARGSSPLSRFIENQHGGIVNQRFGQTKSLLHAPRQAVHEVISLVPQVQ